MEVTTMIHRHDLVLGAALLLAATQGWAGDTAGTTIDDAALNTRINAALVGDPVTKARQIDVEVSDGIVQLNGHVDSAAARTRAEEVARGIPGVREIRNNLLVVTTDRPAGTVIDDGVITTRVKAALVADETTKAYQINVSTRQGVVQLSGFVESEAARVAAERVAREVKGVLDVRNEVDVSG
jgi:hyperosmotically inducible protein